MQTTMSTGRGDWTTGRTGGHGDISQAVVPVIGTATLALLALSRQSLLGKLLFGMPALLVGRQAIEAVRDVSTARSVGHGVLFDESIHVEKAPREVYDFFRKFENLPRFMHHTHDVREDENGRIHWVASLGNGVRMEWDAVLIDDVPGKLISWRSAPEEPFEETGTVRFEAAGTGTNVMLRVAYDFAWTPGGMMIAKATEGWTSKMIADELSSLKRLIEGQPSPTAAAAPTVAPPVGSPMGS
jgi:uncharacterized membrane protein